MPKITGPLHSDSASGQIGKSLIFLNRRGGAVAKSYAKPRNRRSAGQLATRAFTKLLMQTWPTLAPEVQATWDQLAKNANISPINAYTQWNWTLHKQGLDPINRFGGLDVIVFTDLSNDLTIANWELDGPDPAPTATYADGTITIHHAEDLGTAIAHADDPFQTAGDWRQCTALEDLELNATGITSPPLVANLQNLQSLDLSINPLTDPPDIAGCTGLNYLNLYQTAIDDTDKIDALIIQLAATTTQTNGFFDVGGGTNATPTSASADAREILTNNGWSINTN